MENDSRLVRAHHVIEFAKAAKNYALFQSGGSANFNNFTGANISSAGTSGIVPAPQAGDEDKFLCGNGSWATVDSGLSYADRLKLDGIDTGAQENIIEKIQLNGTPLPIDNKSVNIDISGKVDKVAGKQLSAEDFTTAEKNKLAAFNVNAQENVIESFSVNGIRQPVTNKNVNIDLSKYVQGTDAGSAYHYKGSVNSFANLPSSGQTVGDVYNIKTAGGTDLNGDNVNAGDNIAWTGEGWDVLAGTIDLAGYVQKVAGKDLSSNDFTDAYKTKLDGLSSYTLNPATNSKLGGVKIGNGFNIATDGTLDCTIKGETYSNFTGATSSKAGASGLVPAPQPGDANKFLSGDGTWTGISLMVGGGDSGVVLGNSDKAVQGGLWAATITDATGTSQPVIKLRYNDYEYNFKYDTQTKVSGSTSTLIPSAGIMYSLASARNSQEGGLWYSVSDGTPVLMMHQGSFDYGFAYDSITYKGDNSNMLSYCSFNSTLADACSNIAWASSKATVSECPLGYNALNTSTGSLTGKYDFRAPWTIDFWFYCDAFTASKTYNFLSLNTYNSNYNSGTFALSISNGAIKIHTDVIGTDTIALGKRNHIAIVSPKVNSLKIYCNGQLCHSDSVYKAAGINFCTSASAPKSFYFDHFRMFNTALWTSNFTPPTADDYNR